MFRLNLSHLFRALIRKTDDFILLKLRDPRFVPTKQMLLERLWCSYIRWCDLPLWKSLHPQQWQSLPLATTQLQTILYDWGIENSIYKILRLLLSSPVVSTPVTASLDIVLTFDIVGSKKKRMCTGAQNEMRSSSENLNACTHSV